MRIRRLNPRSVLVAVFFAIFAIWLYPTLAALHERWSSAAIEYSYFVVLLAGFLFYRRVVVNAAVAAPGGIGWFLMFLPCVALVFVSNVIGVAFIPQALFPVLLLAAIGMALGDPIAKRAILPIAFLYFCIPFWQAFEYLGVHGRPFNEALRQLTTLVASGAIRLTGLPALIDGDFIALPAGTFEIAEGCSGRAYFITALELSAFYAIAFLNENRNRVLLVVVASALALIGNWIRVFSLVMIGYFSNMQSSLVSDHGDFGWVVFCVTTLPFILFGRWLEGRERTNQQSGAGRAVKHAGEESLRWLAAASVVLTAVLLTNFRLASIEETAEPIHWDGSIVSGEWRNLGDWPPETRPKYPDAGSQWSALLSDGRTDIAVYLADYPFQSQEKEAIHFGNDPFAGQTADAQGVARIDAIGMTDSLSFRVYKSVDRSTSRLIWVGYRVAGKSTADRLEAKLSQLRGVIRGRWDAQVYVLAAECSADCLAENEKLRSFIVDHGSMFFSDERGKHSGRVDD